MCVSLSVSHVSLASIVVAIESSWCHLNPILRQLSWRRIFTSPWTSKLDLSELDYQEIISIGASYVRALGAEENDGSSAIRRHFNKSMGCPSRLST
ncbi:hypothetical protein B296_00039270 [Ensete ventricosum]|uniref:Uncharacterized protein n=1 Tax=Ensete ventricosum TaxID=4639 RepID=A0A426X0Y5_ENSVE|nr:hypothetical protein B296_00039270 [Ensete ventricosum]